MFYASIQDSPFKGSCVFRVFVVDLFDCPENIITGKFLSRLGCRVVVFLFLIFDFFVFFFKTQNILDEVREFTLF